MSLPRRSHAGLPQVQNKYVTADTSIPSDPVRLKCNDMPAIINPGSAAVCDVHASDPDKPMTEIPNWGVEPEYYRNGASGLVLFVN